MKYLKRFNMSGHKLIGPFAQVLPLSGLSLEGSLTDEQLQPISNGGILVSEGKIRKIGAFQNLEAEAETIERIEHKSVCLPGFIDAHTHICFGGSRANDYAMRNSGKGYLEIAKAGGGIWDTVTKTRDASQETLIRGMMKRCTSHLHLGVTTLEVKSGYGLSVNEELKMLRAIKRASELVVQDIVVTCLAAHMKPRDWVGSPVLYLEEIANRLFPVLQSEKLSNRIDAFIEESAFSPSEIEPYFSKAKGMGFDIVVHADQFTTGGSQVAVDFGAISADHLEASTEQEIKMLANSSVIAMALPGASIGLGCSFTPARKILDMGGVLAIASDHNPGSAPMGNLLTQACILGTFEKLSNAEVLAGITFRAAAALNLTDRGSLEVGKKADFVIFPTDNYQEVTYHQGQLKPHGVWKNGTRVF